MSAYDIVTWNSTTHSNKRVPSASNVFDFMSVRVGANNLTMGQTGSGGSAAFDFNSRKLSNVSNGVANNDAVNFGQMNAAIDFAVLTGGSLKEAVLVTEQLSAAQGILASAVFYATGVAQIGDTFVLKDGTTTETWTFAAAAGAFAPATGASAVASMQNLAAKIAAESTVWNAKYVTTLSSINAGAVVIWEKTSAAGTSTSRFYGVWATPSSANAVFYNGQTEYKTSVASIQLPSTDPAAGRFGFRRQLASLVNGEIHYIHETDIMEAWDQDTTNWVTFQNGAVPDATSASGGGIKGKVTADSDFGLSITAGIMKIVTDIGGALTFNAGALGILLQGSTLAQSASGLKVAAAGITATELASSVAGNGLTGGAGSALDVVAGDGIKSNANDIQVDYTEQFQNDNGGAITVRQMVYVKSNGNVDLAQSTTANLQKLRVGIVEAASISSAAVGAIYMRSGAVVPGFTGLIAGEKVYISKATAGSYTQDLSSFTTGDHVYRVGYAISGTEIEFDPEHEIEL